MIVIVLIILVIAAVAAAAAGSTIIGGAAPMTIAIYSDNKLPVPRGWKLVTKKYSRYVDFLYCSDPHIQEVNINRIRARLRPKLNARQLTNKTRMSVALMQSAPDAICESYLVHKGDSLPPGVWIIKAGWGWKGLANIVIADPAELDAAIDRISTNNRGVDASDDIIASRYIVDPMLFRGYKFHLRLFLILYIDQQDRISAWMLRRGMIVPGGKPYVAADWADQDVHDSHLSRNPDLVSVYPDDLPDSTVADRIPALFTQVITALAGTISRYPEAATQYEVFGVDVMIEANGTPRLLEFNPFPRIWPQWEPCIYSAVLDTAFAASFGLEKKLNPDIIKVY